MKKRSPAELGQRSRRSSPKASALARLVTRIGLVDDIDATLAPDEAVVAMPLPERLERIADLHDVTK